MYTPAPVVSRILDAAGLGAPEALAGASVCDPACGDGEFLVAVARRALRWLPRDRALAALRRLAGFDIDPAALAACRERLDSVVRERYPRARVRWRLSERNGLDRRGFAEVAGRFTHVVGNPPYVRVQHLERSGRERAEGWEFARGATDLFLVFFELGLELLRRGGILGYITPSSWLRSQAAGAFRAHLSTAHRVRRILDFGDHQVFPGVTTYTAITVVERGGAPRPVPVWRFAEGRFAHAGTVETDPVRPAAPWVPATAAERRCRRALAGRGPLLDQIADIHVGVQTLADRVFILRLRDGADGDLVECAGQGRTVRLERWLLRPIVKASVLRDGRDPVRRVIVFPYDREGRLLPEAEIADRAPRAHRWLADHRADLLGRDKGRTDPRRWYGFGRQVSIVSGFGDKLLTSGMNRSPNFQRCADPEATFYSGYCVKPRTPLDWDALGAALNSEAMAAFIRATSRPYQGGWFSYAKSFIRSFPVPAEVLAGGVAGRPADQERRAAPDPSGKKGGRV